MRQIDDFEGEMINDNIDLLDRQIHFDWTPVDKFRAKLYQLDTEGRWHDLGTGYFSIDHKGANQYKMILIQEQNNSVDLLYNEIIE
jgi:hypothetical protein